MNESSMHRADFISAMFLIAFGVATVVVSLRMPTFAELGASPYSAPGIMPLFVGTVIAVLGGVLLVRSILHGGYRLGLTREKIGGIIRNPSIVRILVTVTLSVVYGLVLLGRISFILATGLYVFAFVMAFEFRFREPIGGQWKTLISGLVLAVLVTLSVSATFRYAFLVTLP